MRQDTRAVIFLLLISLSGLFGACSDESGDNGGAECGPNKPCPNNLTCNLETGKCVAPNNATVMLGVQVAGMGSVSAMDGSMSFGPCTTANCSYTVATNSNASLTASAAAGWKLSAWSGDCTGTAANVSVKMDMNRTCKATFVAAPAGVPVTVTPTTGGTVSTNPALTCTSGTCTGSVPAGTSVTLTATPMTGYRFVSWAGSAACDGKTTSPLTVTVTGELMCTARFVQTLSVTVSSDTSGAPVTVTTDTCSGTSCPADKGSNATFTAGTLAGYRFTGWTGDAACTGNSATFTVKIDGPLTCQAHYAKRLKVTGLVQDGLTGDVKADAPDASSVCSGNACTVDAGNAVNLVAPTIAGHRITGWTGAGCEGGVVSGSGITIKPSTADVTCTAQYILGVSVSGTVVGAVGQVTATSPSGGTCSAGSCSIDAGGEVVLAAPTIANARFIDWEGSAAVCTGTAMSLDLKNVQSTLSCEAHYVQRIAVGWSLPAGIEGAVTATASDPHAQCNDTRCIVDQGTTVALTPPNQDGFRFLGWQGAGCETGTVTAGENTTCKATYAQEIVVTGNVVGATGTVAATSTSAGNSCADNHCTLDAGGDVTLSAPDLTPGDRFTMWDGDAICTTGAGVRTLVLTAVAATTTCNANYIHRVKVSTATEAGVTDPVVLMLDDPNAQMVGNDWYVDTGTGVQLTAPAVDGKRFKAWTGSADCNGKTANPLRFTPTADVSCTATYQAQVLVKAVGNPASATVTVSGPGCAAGSTSCTVDAGSNMTFTASDLSGFRFSGWSGSTGCTGTANPLAVTANGDTTCTANYVQQFVVMGSAGANGTVSVAAVASTCTGRVCNCSGQSCTVDAGATVRLTPTPSSGFDFNQWSGTGCTPITSNPLDLTNVSASCAASFKQQTFAVSGAANPAAAGNVSLSCGSACGSVPFNSQVTFGASVNNGYVFKGWDATCAAGATNPQIPTRTTVTIKGNLTCTASYRIQVQGSIDAPSTIQGAASSGVCGAAGQITTCAVDPGSSVTFTANLATDSRFVSWSGCPGGVLANIQSPAASCAANVYNLFATIFGRDGSETVAKVFSPDGKTLTAVTQTQVNGVTVGARTLNVNESGDFDDAFTYAFTATSVNGGDLYATTGGSVILSTVPSPVAGAQINEPHLLILDGSGRRVASKAYLMRTSQTGKTVIGGSDGKVRFLTNAGGVARLVTTDSAGAIALDAGGAKLDFIFRTVSLADCKTPRVTTASALVDAGQGASYLILTPSGNDAGTDFEVVRLTAQGAPAWVVQIVGATTLAPTAANVVNGNLVVTGLASEGGQNPGAADAFVVELDASGKNVFSADVAGRVFGRATAGITVANDGFLGAAAGRSGQLLVSGTIATAVIGGTVPINSQQGWLVLLNADGTLSKDMVYGVNGGLNTLVGALAPATGGYLALGATASTQVSPTAPDLWGLRVANDLTITMNPQFSTVVQASGAAERAVLTSSLKDKSCVARGPTDGATDPTDVSVDGPTTTDVTEHVLAP